MTPTEFVREYETETRARGLDYTLKVIDEKAVYWFSDGSSHVGKDQIERIFRQNAELIRGDTYHIRDVQWLVESAEVACCIFRFEWSGKVHGKPASGKGRGTWILKKREDSWVIVHEHLSKGE